MINAITICNGALQYLGLHDISSFQDPSKEAHFLASLYPLARNELLERFDFSFSTRIEYLPQIADTIAQEQTKTYVFQLPTYCLRVRSILNTKNYFFGQNKTIHSTAQKLLVVMTSIVDDPNTCSALFIEALKCRISSMLATALLGDSSLADSFYKRYLITFEEAQRIDGTTLERENTLAQYTTY